jgi:hypothetical protein
MGTASFFGIGLKEVKALPKKDIVDSGSMHKRKKELRLLSQTISTINP